MKPHQEMVMDGYIASLVEAHVCGNSISDVIVAHKGPVREVVYGENNFKERVDIGPMTNWQRISATEYRLDDVWTVKKEHTFWRAYRGKSPTLQGFFERKNAMKEAERLRKEDEAYGT